jgi:hypothetical protein
MLTGVTAEPRLSMTDLIEQDGLDSSIKCLKNVTDEQGIVSML